MRKDYLFKRIAITLSAVMILSLAGCSGNNAKSNADSSTAKNDGKTAGVTQEAQTADGPFGAYPEEITYTLGRQTIQNPKLPDGDTYENNAYTRYVKDRLNAVAVDAFEANGEDYDRQVSLAIASEDLPDIMKIGSKDILDELVENDMVEDLTDVYNTYASDYLKEIYDSYDGRSLSTATYDEKIMALPGTNVDSAPNEVWVRQDWLDKLGLKVDEDGNGMITVDELKNIAETFMEKDPGSSKNPVGISLAYWLSSNDYGGSTYCATGIANALGAYPKLWLKNTDGSVYYGSNTEENKKTLGVLADWFKEGILDPQFGTRTWDDITALLTNGQTGITFGVWHIPDWLLNNVRAMDKNATFSTYVIEGENGKANVFHNNASSGYIVVRKGYKHPELAVKISNLFYDELANTKTLEKDYPEVAKYQADGVDGSTRPFNVEINKYTSLLDDYSDIKKGVDGEIAIEDARTLESRNVIQNVKRYLENTATDDVTDWSKYHSRMKGIELIDKLTRENSFNWVEPVFWGTTETMKSNWANLQKLEEETFIKIVTGSVPLNDFDKYVKDWNDQGGSQIISEIEATIK
ncbi:type 2 periplasmic-binding domain-containing protein [Anaerocolumna xylanovorans]|uniref:Putative aldouronate transport system substrate-binding protein n=1 Tax=Anaerocolumna xylanovorans DSM 12503 TaxID=1121345 RepID=A0A1M7XZ87_9FIRM|nr:sugar ABC transporter substrate-binding protein [Anaerocolumna xylanovorans]SHO44445.1 putative aldouronate transport system substrate-binding protein [Anaerocolumna xylanovorans DSM 12503]